MLTPKQLQANADYFQKIIDQRADVYIWKEEREVFVIDDGKLKGTKRGVRCCKEITPKSFHHKLEEAKPKPKR